MENQANQGGGLLQQGQRQAPPQQQAPQQQQQGAESNDAYVAQFNQAVALATDIIHDKRTIDVMAKQVAKGLPGIVEVTLAVVGKVEGMAAKGGKELNAAILLGVAGVVIQQLTELAVTSGGQQMNDEQKQAILETVVRQYTEKGIQSGKFTKEQAAQTAQALQQGQQGQGAAPPQPGQQPPPQPQPGV